jgi:hypothetical protein
VKRSISAQMSRPIIAVVLLALFVVAGVALSVVDGSS